MTKIYIKRYILTLALLLISNISYAGISVCEGENGRIYKTALRGNSIDGCFYYDPGLDITEQQYNDIKTLIQNVPLEYLKMENGLPVEITQEEKAQVNQDLETAKNIQESNAIDNGQITPNDLLKAMVAVVSESKDTSEVTEQAVIDKIKEQKGVL